MLTLPTSIMALLEPFRPVFHEQTWNKVQVLWVGAILAPGKRTVTSALRAVGLADEPGSANTIRYSIAPYGRRNEPASCY